MRFFFSSLYPHNLNKLLTDSISLMSYICLETRWHSVKVSFPFIQPVDIRGPNNVSLPQILHGTFERLFQVTATYFKTHLSLLIAPESSSSLKTALRDQTDFTSELNLPSNLRFKKIRISNRC